MHQHPRDYFGPSIFLGTTALSNSSAESRPRLTASSLSVDPFLCAVLAIFAALSYPITGFRAVTSMSDSLSSWLTRSSLTRRPSMQCFRKEVDESARRRELCSALAIIIGLKTLSSKCPLLPPTLIATALPMTCAHTMVIASHCVGLTLPGIMELPGSFSGRMSSPRPQRGPEPRRRMSLAIFIKEHAMVFKTPPHSTTASCAANASNLFGAGVNGSPVVFEISAHTFSSKPMRVLSPVPTAVPPIANM
mmetsp:Transcript_28683/g.72021  ORF Transcript_28683/g.72021 Transcript_28683/m.72021 type:complete len:249 (-) Transcript_28683:730-1476(-)